MDCPKCGNKQSDSVKCGSCGIYFAKLRPPPSATPTPSSPTNRQRDTPPESGFGLGTLAVTATTINLQANVNVTGGTTPGTVSLKGNVVLLGSESITYGGTNALTVTGSISLGSNTLTLVDGTSTDTDTLSSQITGTGGGPSPGQPIPPSK